jgi:excinuclease ABC subunit A
LDSIRVRGARVHNLKNLDLEIPRNKLTVITGPSGSGKSSLAFDTLYAEGQRRYVESLSTYARQFLERVDRPDVDAIDGLPPAIAIQQKGTPTSGRSTVGTATEIYDYLRLLFARIGRTHCSGCGREVEEENVERVVGRLMDGTAFASSEAPRRLTIGFPLNAARVLESVSPAEFLGDLRANGFLRVRVEDAVLSIDDPGALAIGKETKLAVIVDRISLSGPSAAAGAGRIPTVSVDAGPVGTRSDGPVPVGADPVGTSPVGTSPVGTVPVGTVPVGTVPVGTGPLGSAPGEAGGRIEPVPDESSNGHRRRLAEAVETAYRFGHGRLIAFDGDGEEARFSEALHCASCDRDYRQPTPAFFSFNSPLGACPACQGFGRSILLDPDLIVPDRRKTLAEGAIDPFNKPAYKGAYDDLRKVGKKQGLRWDVPYEDLPARHRRLIEEGEGDWYGIKGFFEWLEGKIYKVHVRVFLSRYRTYRTCTACGGGRLRPEVLLVKVGGLDIASVCRMTIGWDREFFGSLDLTAKEEAISRPILKEIRQRLRYLDEVGLDYLTLDRMSRTLSGGEAQRIGLASCLGSGLVGTLYVLDEPSIGLHPRDGDRLIHVMSELRDIGNTVVVVEHDEATIRAADVIIDLGPAAGEKGGEIVGRGTPEEIIDAPASRTGAYLSGREAIAVPGRRRSPVRGRWLELSGARANNLKDLQVRIPLGIFTCITGVSGSGKSSLIEETLYPAILRAKGRGKERAARDPGAYAELRGADRIRDVVMVDQSPIGKTPRSNPITYMKGFDEIRRIFAGQRSAMAAGLDAGAFSFNVPGGRCDVCEGQGVVTMEMQFLADLVLPCEACGGKRFKREVLAVRRGGRSIADVLEMTVDEAVRFFAGQTALISRLGALARTGLGYLRLGQPATTLSGGESQRLKLAAAMYGGGTGVLYIFDEPTTGLHFSDVALLLGCFERLVRADNSVLVVEHNMDVVKCADWVIDLGPEGGEAGGRIVAEGSPSEVARARTHTSRYLALALDGP